MRKNIFRYLVLHEIAWLLVYIFCGISTGVFFALLVTKFDDGIGINPFFLIETCVLGACIGNMRVQDLIEYKQFQTFLFCRKRFFQYQTGLCVLKSVILAFVRALYQTIIYQGNTGSLMEDIEDVAYYHVSFLELFITSICFFVLLNFVDLVLHTVPISFLPLQEKVISLQLKQRIQARKEQSSKEKKVFTAIFVMVGWIIWAATFVGIAMYYDAEIRLDMPVRIGVIVVSFVVCVILYMIGKKRYCPEYV